MTTIRSLSRFFPAAGPALASLAAVALLAVAAPRAHELKDVTLQNEKGQLSLKLSFVPGPADGEYPPFFQKTDISKGTVTLSFLETETSFPLGRHALDPNSAIEEILLKKVVSPSGKNFLGVELKMHVPPAGDFPVDPAPRNVLKVALGKAPAAKKISWSLAKSVKAGDAYLNAKAEPAPSDGAPGPKDAASAPGNSAVTPGAKARGAKAGKGPHAAQASAPAEAGPNAGANEAATASAASPATPGEPGVQGAEPAAPNIPSEPAAPNGEVSGAGGSAALAEIKLLATPAQEDLILAFDPPSTPNYVPKRDGKDSSWQELAIEGVSSKLAKTDFAVPRSTLFKKIRIAYKNGRLTVRVQLAPKAQVQIVPQDNGLALSGAGPGGEAPAFTWSTSKPQGVVSDNVAEAPDPVKSAHEEGEAMDAGHAKGLSSSKTFSVGAGGKAMIVMKDSAALRSQPGAKGKVIRKIGIGEKVEKIDGKGSWSRVAAEADTGFMKAGEVVYQDEVTPAQDKAIQKTLAAKQAKAAALAAKAEEKARKEAEAAEAAKKKAELMAAQEQPQDMRQANAAPARGKPMGLKPNGPQPNVPAGPQPGGLSAKLAIADNPELADKLAKERAAAEDEKKRIEPEENRVSYNSYGRRDPFIPVEQGAADNGIDIDQMKVVGIIWQSQQPMAVLEHNKEAGVSFTVKVGDPVHNGRVSHITNDAVTFDISEYGISRSYSLKLVSSKEGTKK